MPARKRPRPAPRALWMDAIEETWRRTGFTARFHGGALTSRSYETSPESGDRNPGVTP